MIFVTGGTGLVGSYLLFDLVKSGKEVRALKRPNSSLAAIQTLFSYYSSDLFHKIQWVDGDVLDIYSLQEAMQGAEEVYHCAALVSFHKQDREKMLTINAEGTANMVNVALELDIKKFCHVSSTAAIGKSKISTVLDEDSPWDMSYSHSSYAISKYASEQEVWRAIAEGLNAVIVNPCVILGAGEWGRSSTDIINKSWKGMKFYTSGGNAFVDVRDVSKAMIALMEKNIMRERFLIVSKNLPHKTVFEWIANGLGKPKPSIKVNRFLGAIAWRVEKLLCFFTGNSPRITRESMQSAQRVYCYSNKKIKETIDIDFIPIKQSIKDTCDIFLATR